MLNIQGVCQQACTGQKWQQGQQSKLVFGYGHGLIVGQNGRLANLDNAGQPLLHFNMTKFYPIKQKTQHVAGFL